MSANIDTMFSVREVPWHGEGDILDEHPTTWPEFRQASGLLWEPIEEICYRLAGVDGEGRPIYEPIDGFKQVVRSDTAATLAIPRDSYSLINHDEMGSIIEAVLDQTSSLRYETGGSLMGGRKVWALLLLDEPIELPGDASITLPYFAFTNHHDGMGAAALRATAVRIVCANTFGAAELEGQRTGATFSFRHTKNWKDHVTEAREAVTGARRQLVAYRELAEALLGMPITAGQRELFVTAFVPAPPEGLTTDRVKGNIEQARQSIRDILASKTCEGIEGTGYGLVQAAGEYLDHVRGTRSWESKLNRTLLTPEPLKAKAVALAREIAKV